MIFFPGEAFVEYQLMAKKHSPTSYTMFIGYANGYIGYVPYALQPASGDNYEEIVSIIDPSEYGRVAELILKALRD